MRQAEEAIEGSVSGPSQPRTCGLISAAMLARSEVLRRRRCHALIVWLSALRAVGAMAGAKLMK